MKSHIITFLLATLVVANPLPESNAEAGEAGEAGEAAVSRVISGDVSAQDCSGGWQCPDYLWICCDTYPPLCCPRPNFVTCGYYGGRAVCFYRTGKYTPVPPLVMLLLALPAYVTTVGI